MAQFQVYRRTDLIDTGSRVVAPLVGVAVGLGVIGRLEPVYKVLGEDCALHTPPRWRQSPPRYSEDSQSPIYLDLTMRSGAPSTWSSLVSDIPC